MLFLKRRIKRMSVKEILDLKNIDWRDTYRHVSLWKTLLSKVSTKEDVFRLTNSCWDFMPENRRQEIVLSAKGSLRLRDRLALRGDTSCRLWLDVDPGDDFKFSLKLFYDLNEGPNWEKALQNIANTSWLHKRIGYATLIKLYPLVPKAKQDEIVRRIFSGQNTFDKWEKVTKVTFREEALEQWILQCHERGEYAIILAECPDVLEARMYSLILPKLSRLSVQVSDKKEN